MPKTVDHDARRAQIAEALIRVAARDGLHAATMRAVAAEAGVSLRLVQYYFETKSGLLNGALEHLERRSHQRWRARIEAAGAAVSPRMVVEALLVEALPTDEPSRAFHLVWTSYAVLAMSDPELASQSFVDGPNRLERQLVELLRAARADGQVAADRDPALEAARLLALGNGLGTSVLVGQRTPEAAREILDRHLTELFGVGRARRRASRS